ncbi:restriction endonuclease subunit S [Leptospira harrisiae]|uniref:Type I restriction modification DNA specificity domain-containing protein n=1 Tax=Leptospira harrisiae TaxID=2023189 RepID=A0A2N0AI90_9LEPT|nr:restriction endonuclease subunit S [Leptospira harrisiae]PJZ83997.1 hypothetical protein CH364_14710 [Leptospira harrisiae]PKA07545.1 hypothetical protein CH366_14235 [Leptospira harrisiae]
MKRYEAYKDSSVEWLGEIPTHWEVKRLKYLANVNKPKPTELLKEFLDSEVVFLPMEKVSEDGKFDQSILKKTDEVSSGFTYFERGDIIIAKITPCFENGKGAYLKNLNTSFGFGSTEFHTVKPSESINPVFAYYQTKSNVFMKVGEGFMSGSAGQKRLPTSFIEEFPFPLPPLTEQTSIASFLDRKTSQIDSLVEKKKRLIELLKEEKAAVINQAVTKGIDPNVKMKDSGVEWLGEIPEHWEVKKLKWVAEKVQTGSTPPSNQLDYYVEEIDWYTPSDFSESLELNSSKRKISNSAISDQVVKLFPANSILFVGIGATIGKVGYITEPASSNQQINALLFESIIDSKFYSYFLYSMREHIAGLSNSATLPILNQSQMKDIDLPVPSSNSEMESIVNFVKVHTDKIFSTISKIEKEIELLQEYRTALISEVVTGKVRVGE